MPVPEPGHGQVRIKVEAAGVCLSDVHLIDGTLTPLYLAGDVGDPRATRWPGRSTRSARG